MDFTLCSCKLTLIYNHPVPFQRGVLDELLWDGNGEPQGIASFIFFIFLFKEHETLERFCINESLDKYKSGITPCC